ncbi:hypothetical protein Vadar_017880 [Vaccinium darrowii]|uniref:Uncharacterized protein n=1 Tax=Vaccinium darrowii TaxID=229202 RepID=A0ACB7YMQ0_9ERIC|nr:hypothetical protein Vadar_017880 [Vaccinium darrowii]
MTEERNPAEEAAQVRVDLGHYHPLILIRKEETKARWDLTCYGCEKPILDESFYGCKQCLFFLHQSCRNIPPELTHPYHPQHPLTFRPIPAYQRSADCDICDEFCERFTYHCSACEYDIDMKCALVLLSVQRSIQSKSHPHQLIPLLQESTFLCAACGIKHEGTSFLCTTCGFWFNQKCASSPLNLNLSNHHPHTLSLFYFIEEDYNHLPRCKICSEIIDRRYWVYRCSECRDYDVHFHCAVSAKEHSTNNETKTKETVTATLDVVLSKVPSGKKNSQELDPTPINLPMIDDSVDIITQFIKNAGMQGKHREAAEIEHRSHEHPLTYFEKPIDLTTSLSTLLNGARNYEKSTAKAPTYGFNQSLGEDSQQKKAADVTSTPSLNKTNRAIEIRAQKGKRPITLSDIENEPALPVIQQVDDSAPSVQPEINDFVPSVQNVEQEKLIDIPPIVTQAEPVIEPTTKNSSQSLEIVEKTKLPAVKMKIKPKAQSQYELRKRPHETNMEETSRSQPLTHETNMEETSRSQPLRKRPRKIEPETQPETQNQTQGEVNAKRCSLLSIIRIVKETELNDQHIASLKRTPFWLLFDAIISKKLQSDQCRKFDEVVLKIVQSYEEDTEAFTVGSKNIKFTSNHVRLVFGICCGNKEMTETKIKKESTALAKRLEIKESRLSTTTIERKIKELQKSMKQQDIDDVVRLLCLHLCVMLLFSNKANSINWSYVHYMEDLEKVKEYDWASAVSKYLLDSIHKNHRDIKQLKGSSILLLYFLCEHTKLVEVKTANGVLRLLKWKISDLRRSLKDFNHLSQLPWDKVNNTNLEETAEEKKIFGELCAIDGGKREFSGQQQHEKVQPMLTDNDTEATAALVLLGKKEDEICEEEEQEKDEIHVGQKDEFCGHHGNEVQVSAEQKQNEVEICSEQEKLPMLTDNDTEATAALVLLGKKENEICEEEEQEKDKIHVGEEDKICGNQGDEVQVFAQQKQNEVEICTEQEKYEVEENVSTVHELNDLSSSSYPSLHLDSFHTTQETDSGTTLVPNTLPIEMEQPNDHSMEVIDKLKKQIETLEQEKKKLEIENMEIRQKKMRRHYNPIRMRLKSSTANLKKYKGQSKVKLLQETKKMST